MVATISAILFAIALVIGITVGTMSYPYVGVFTTLFGTAAFVLQGMVRIPDGKVGLVKFQGQPLPKVAPEGSWQFYPLNGLFWRFEAVDVSHKLTKIEGVEVRSKDGARITVDVSITWKADVAHIDTYLETSKDINVIPEMLKGEIIERMQQWGREHNESWMESLMGQGNAKLNIISQIRGVEINGDGYRYNGQELVESRSPGFPLPNIGIFITNLYIVNPRRMAALALEDEQTVKEFKKRITPEQLVKELDVPYLSLKTLEKRRDELIKENPKDEDMIRKMYDLIRDRRMSDL